MGQRCQKDSKKYKRFGSSSGNYGRDRPAAGPDQAVRGKEKREKSRNPALIREISSGRRPERLQSGDEFEHFGNTAAKIDPRGDLEQLGPRQFPGDDKGNADALGCLEKEFFELEVPGDAGKVGIEIVGLFHPADKFDILERDIGSEI